ncbi:MAG TPA: ribonuclease P protein component [Salinisphaeraceae bacterium]|nr:ribonuclease P protein component [Salinisphaeraceae bacterium]
MAQAKFPAAARLHHAPEFSVVFRRGRRFARSGLVVIIAPGKQPQARLGLAVAKRHLPRAVDRNRVKRLIRESFRRQRAHLGALDVVVLARAATVTLPNRRLRGQLHSIWSEIHNSCRKSARVAPDGAANGS